MSSPEEGHRNLAYIRTYNSTTVVRCCLGGRTAVGQPRKTIAGHGVRSSASFTPRDRPPLRFSSLCLTEPTCIDRFVRGARCADDDATCVSQKNNPIFTKMFSLKHRDSSMIVVIVVIVVNKLVITILIVVNKLVFTTIITTTVVVFDSSRGLEVQSEKKGSAPPPALLQQVYHNPTQSAGDRVLAAAGEKRVGWWGDFQNKIL